MNEGQFMKISFRIFDVPRFGEHKHRSFIFQPACKMHFFWRAKINFTWLERWRKMQNAKWKMKIERRQRRIKATWKTIFLLRQMPRVATTHRQKHRCQSSFFSLKFKMLMHISLMTFVRRWNLASRRLRDDVIIEYWLQMSFNDSHPRRERISRLHRTMFTRRFPHETEDAWKTLRLPLWRMNI